MLLNLREYHRPESLAEAVGILRQGGGRAAVLAGGTELTARTDTEIEAVVDLERLGLSGIRFEDGLLRLGAMTTLSALRADPTVLALAGGLLARAVTFSAPATIRAAATLGGTLAGQKGGVEVPAALLALGARVVLATPEPVELSFRIFATGRQDLLDGYILTEVLVPLREGARGGLARVSRTPADRSLCCAAAVAGDGRPPTVALGGVAPAPRLWTPEEDLSAWEVLSDPIGSDAYRRWVAPVLARRALAEAGSAMETGAG